MNDPVRISEPEAGWGAFYRLVVYMSRQVFYTLGRCEIVGQYNVPKSGSFILACNHASYFDPPLAGSHVPRAICYFARKTLFKPGLPALILNNLNTIPVDRDGDSDVGAFKKVFAVLKEGRGLLLFPEGTRTPDGNLQPARRGVGLIACRAQVPVLPTRVFGTYEMFPKSGGFHPFGSLSVVFGPVLKPEDFDPGKDDPDRYQTASNRIMAAIAALEKPTGPIV